MNDPIERYYEEFETRYAAVARPAARPVHRFPVRRVAIVGAVAALAVGIAVAVLPGTGPGGSTAYAVERAKAVLSTDNAVLHIVSVTTQPLGGKQEKLRGEQWHGPGALRYSVEGESVDREDTAVRWDPRESSADGKLRVRSDSYEPATNTHTFYVTRLERDSALFRMDPTSAMRRLLASGRVTDEGIVDLNGRQARKLVAQKAPTSPKQTGPNSGIASKPGSVAEYYIDPKTYVPIRIRWSVGDPVNNQWVVDDVVQFERLPLTAQNRKLLRITIPAGAKADDQTKFWNEVLKQREAEPARRTP